MSSDGGQLGPYWEGFYAPQNGATKEDCPYEIGTLAQLQWLDGYKDAQPDDAEEDEG